MEKFGKFCFLFLIASVSSVINAICVLKLWNWFVVYTFPEIKELSLLDSIGIIIFFRYLIADFNFEQDSNLTQKMIYTILYSFLTLLIGYILVSIR